MTTLNAKESNLAVIEHWYERLPIEKGFKVRGAIAAALQILEKLKVDYNLDTNHHLTERKGQVSGISGASLARILADFDEHRVFLREGGRTNRGVIGYIDSLLDDLQIAKLENIEADDRNEIITSFQAYLVDKVRDYHGQQRIQIEYDPTKTAWQTVADLLAKARETSKDGPVAQYLIGAKLALRFPDIEIGNESYSTADDQLTRSGDFSIGDTAFHVTVSPLQGLYERCRQNVRQGYRVYVLVPNRRLQGIRDTIEDVDMLREKISVESIETFVSQNLEELSTFKTDELTTGFRLLLEKYNERVGSVETDKSLMIEIPPNLLR